MKPLFLALLLVLSGTTGAAATRGSSPPNIVFILADDLGAHDVGCYGERNIQTPNIDRLAATGRLFTNAYAAASICSPTRAALLTGKSPARLHITDWIPGRSITRELREPDWCREMPKSERTIAEVLRSAGYATAIIGKWHLGDYRAQREHGFDVVHGPNATAERGDPSSWFSPYGDPTLPDGPAGEYLTDRLTKEAVKFITENRTRPFFLYLAHNSPHLPLAAKPEDLKKYADAAAALDPKSPVYAAMVDSLDQSVGQIVRTLAELGLEENTLVIFTSDNGGFLGFGPDDPNPEHPASVTTNLPLRGGKRTLFEGGLRVPLIAKLPGRIAPNSTSAVLTSTCDFFPTFAEIAGVKLADTSELDGVSLLPSLLGKAAPADRKLGWHYPHYQLYGLPPGGAWRSGPWKLIVYYDQTAPELYNLESDPGEKRNLASALPAKRDELRSEFNAWLARVGAQMPTPVSRP